MDKVEQYTSDKLGKVNRATIPITEWRTGDFSNYRDAQGNLIPIFDPLTQCANAPLISSTPRSITT